MEFSQFLAFALLSLITTSSIAETRFNNEKNSITTNSHSNSNSSVLSIPDFERNTKEITTDILFFYTESAVNRLGNIDEVYSFIDTSVEQANTYMSMNNISLNRRVAAVLPFNVEIEDVTNSIGYLRVYVAANIDLFERKYNASHYVLVTGDLDKGNIKGEADVGGEYSVIVGSYANGREFSTLAHELGHNDGLFHEVTGQENFETSGGFQCGEAYSLMSPVTYNNIIFLSSPEVINTVTGEVCGEAVVADVRSFYYNAVENDRFNATDFNFHNYLKPKDKVGSVLYSLMSETYNENTGIISIIVNWTGVEDFDSSVELYARSITATREDFKFDNKRINIDSSEGSVVVEIELIDDSQIEDVESFEVGLRHNVGVEFLGEPTEINVISEDELPLIDLGVSGVVTITEGESDVIVINRIGDSSRRVVALLTITNDTASGDDYSIETLEVILEAGELSKDVSFSVIDDLLVEDTETFTVGITSDMDRVTASGSILVTIMDNDIAKPVIPDTPVATESGESGGGFGLGLLFLSFIALLRRNNKLAI
jgi:hypothetical protein